MVCRKLEMGGCRIRPLVVVADEDHRQLADAGKGHRLMGVPARRRAFAEPAHGHALLLANAEGEGAPDRDREHRGKVADHRDQSQLRVGHMDVAVPPSGRTVLATHELREDPPRLDAAHDVNAHVAVQWCTDVVGAHRRGHAHGGAFVAAAGVERARDLALAVEDVAALLDPAAHEHVSVDAEEILAKEARLANLLERANRLGFPGDRHGRRTPTAAVTIASVQDERFAYDRYLVDQLVRPMINLYRVTPLAAGDSPAGGPIAYVRQKRMAIKEDIRFFADEQETQELFRIKARSMFDMGGARYDVTDADGVPIGVLEHVFGKSLLRSTWKVTDGYGGEEVAAQEGSLPVAI